MKSSLRLATSVLAIVATTGMSSTSDAGLIPWTYNAIFGPVGSTFGYGAQRPVFGYQANYGYGGYYGYGNSCCGSGGYTAGYTPYYAGYSSYSYPTCNNCCTSGCNSCGSTCNSCNYGYYNYGCNNCCNNNCNGCSNCASGDCNTGLQAATGTTQPEADTNTAKPTTTFKSSEPTVNPKATETNGNSNYNPTTNGSGFEMPSREEEKKTDESSAPPFRFDSGMLSPLNVPSAPMMPVERDQNDSPVRNRTPAPELQVVPAPVAATNLSLQIASDAQPTRMVRTARYHIPVVARHVPMDNSLVPPLPMQVAGK